MPGDPLKVASILSEFRQRSALVIGDVCLDRWCTYDPALTQPSRETGIPRIAVTSTLTTPGASGTVANNLVSLGLGRVALLGAIGDDVFGHELLGSLNRCGISAELLYKTPRLGTFTYTKLINKLTGVEDLPRVDFISDREMPSEIDTEMILRLDAFANAFDVIIVSDQAETDAGGVVTAAVRDRLTQLAQRDPQKVIWVDSRVRAEHFRGLILKPNREEADDACLRSFGRVDYAELRAKTQSPFLVVTRGAEGAMVVDDGGQHVVASPQVDVVDICGAGDSFSAGGAIAYSVTRDPFQAAMFGNLVASITVTKQGTGSATPEEVIRAAETYWSTTAGGSAR
jgi:rfaE bifunctional protein kinase chain/domain